MCVAQHAVRFTIGGDWSLLLVGADHVLSQVIFLILFVFTVLSVRKNRLYSKYQEHSLRCDILDLAIIAETRPTKGHTRERNALILLLTLLFSGYTNHSTTVLIVVTAVLFCEDIASCPVPPQVSTGKKHYDVMLIFSVTQTLMVLGFTIRLRGTVFAING